MKSLICGTLLISMCSHIALASDRPLTFEGGLPSSTSGKIPTFSGGSSSGTNPVRNSFSGDTIVKSGIPKFSGTGGLNLPEFDNKIAAFLSKGMEGFEGFDDPMIEAQSSLISGNDYSAGRACLKAAQTTPAGRGWSDRDIDVFRDPAFGKQMDLKKAFQKLPIELQQRFRKQGPNIFSDPKPCMDNPKARMCRQLLGRSLLDEVQANYKPDDVLKEKKELAPEIALAKKAAEKELETSVQKHDENADISILQSKPDKTMLLIIIIDKALAAGDKIAAQGALESLKEVNPSAAHALECLGIGMKETSFILASEKDSRAEGLLDKDKPRVGPITGYDYSMDLELIEKGGAKDPKKFVEIGWKVVEGILVALGVKASEAGANKAGDFFANEENDKAKARQEHKEWTDCKQSGSAACDQLYPKAVEIEDRAKNGKDVFTGEPLKKDENKDGGTPTHPVNLDPLAGAGAYSGPTIGPGPSDDGTRPVEPDFLDSGEGMFGFSKMTKHDRDELSKTRDPQATENYCQQVVQDFSSVQQKRLTIKTAEDFEIGSALIGRLNGFDGGPISYDGWNDEFWSAMESKDAKNPKFQHEKKNCAVMDPVEPGL